MMYNLLYKIYKHEKNSDIFFKLSEFFNNRKNDYLEDLCMGIFFIPTPLTLKKFLKYNSKLFAHDLKEEFLLAITISQSYYSYIIRSYKDSEDKFEEIYTREIQSIGENFIMQMKHILLMLNVLRIKQAFSSKTEKYNLKLSCIINSPIMLWLYSIMIILVACYGISAFIISSNEIHLEISIFSASILTLFLVIKSIANKLPISFISDESTLAIRYHNLMRYVTI